MHANEREFMKQIDASNNQEGSVCNIVVSFALKLGIGQLQYMLPVIRDLIM